MLRLKEATISELCNRLSTTNSWASKAMREIGLPVSGKGFERRFSEKECYILTCVRIMTICGVSWEEVKALNLLKNDRIPYPILNRVWRVTELLNSFNTEGVLCDTK